MFLNRKWPQQKQFSPTFRNIVFCEAKASKGKKNDILENENPFLKSLPVFVCKFVENCDNYSSLF
jgi:hypothetical protein